VSTRNYFSAAALDRAGHHRRDPEWLTDRLAHPGTRLVVMRSGEVALDPEKRLALVAASDHPLDIAGEGLVFLGLDEQGDAVFAVDLDGDGIADVAAALPTDHAFVDLRGAASFLPAADGHWAAYSSAMQTWHRRHRWCGACGQPTLPDWAGHIRRCTGCGAEHFPRTDPVIIVLVVAGEHCLLGRNVMWPARMWSALAGFVEPGECLEDAVAREVKEETDVTVGQVRYHSSQPWPFPLSLMIGWHADAGPEPPAVTIDPSELSDAVWMRRDELLESAADGAVMLPGPFSIARQLIDAWLAEEV
jgi:NAD+ diphosphatase